MAGTERVEAMEINPETYSPNSEGVPFNDVLEIRQLAEVNRRVLLTAEECHFFGLDPR